MSGGCAEPVGRERRHTEMGDLVSTSSAGSVYGIANSVELKLNRSVDVSGVAVRTRVEYFAGVLGMLRPGCVTANRTDASRAMSSRSLSRISSR